MRLSYAWFRFRRSSAKPRSLKTSLLAGLMMSSILPILLIGALSYYVIYLILDNKTANGVQSTLHQVRMNMEKTYDNLNYVSQQLATRDVQLLFQSDDPAERYVLSQRIFDYLQQVSFTNPDTGLFYIYDAQTNDIFYMNQPVEAGIGTGGLEPLTQSKGVVYHPPHESFSNTKGTVFSVSRPLNIPKRSPQNIYVETNSKLYDQVLNERQYGVQVLQVITDAQGTVVFSQDEERFPPGRRMAGNVSRTDGYEVIGDDYFFREYSEGQEWYLYAVVQKQVLRKEIRNWSVAWLAIAAVSLLFSLAAGASIWRKFYYSLHRLNREIRQFGDNGVQDEKGSRRPIAKTQVVELDVLMEQFQEMRSKIWMLLSELKRNEEDKRHLEVEKVVAQINPHFLYNTLNTVQWIAKANRQEEIVQFLSIFIRLLRYNLGKDGGLVPLQLEISALQDYITLQQMRYQCEFALNVHAVPEALQVKVPRFLLQPLIENALYYGLTEERSTIELRITTETGGGLLVQVMDQGAGIGERDIEKLLKNDIPERDKVGMGIGLNYVNTMLKAYFGDEAKLQTASSEEGGTTMYFRLPWKREEHSDD
ncbi:sensor histidine kinase [Paenibacillus doosanensis]|uniref:sensor histidine kinase n=1 Tax=Paenibacillus doosanensis TaxID=1229154 RepID=UPI00218091DA|nr:histidine kinase [Paenibacillus doosanensis]